MNPRLRTIVAEAKANNMPRENIERAIRRGTGEEPGVSYEEIWYEGYGPGGVALLVHTLTDNKNRTVGEIRHVFSKHAGNLAAENSVAWMFSRKGQIVVEKGKVDEEALLNAALDAGADDMNDDGSAWEIICAPESFEKVRDAQVKTHGPEHATTLATRTNLAGAYRDSGRLDDAIALYQAVLSAPAVNAKPGDPFHWSTANNHAVALRMAGKFDDAIALFEQVRQSQTAARGADDVVTLATRNQLAATWLAAGRVDDAVVVIIAGEDG